MHHLNGIKRLTWLIGLGAMTAGALPGIAMADTVIRADLGRYAPGDTLQIDLQDIVPSPDLRLLLNGQEVALVYATRGRDLVIELPDTLRGARQDITVQRRRDNGFETLGIWSFSNTDSPALVSGAFLGEAGWRAADGQTQSYSFGGGRIDFDAGDTQTRGALTFLLDEQADPATGQRLRIPDWYLETGRDLGTGRVFARLGSQYLETAGVLMDGSARRGVRLGYGGGNGLGQVSVFALGTQAGQDSTDNLLGLADPDARVTGVRVSGMPLGVTGPKVELAAFDGRARRDDASAAGHVTGAELTLGGVLTPRLSYALSYAESTFDDGTGALSGQALTSDLYFGVLPPGDGRDLILSLGYDRITQDFFSPLSRGLIVGEETLSFGLDFTSDVWAWGLELARAETNAGGPATDPVDVLDRAALTVSYQPRVFTGGFLNGTTFYGGFEILTQDRKLSPPGSIAASDSTVRRYSIGFDRLQPDFSLGVLYTHDDFISRSGGSDETVRRLQGLATFDGGRALDATLGAQITHTDGTVQTYWDGDVSAGLRLALIEGKLDYGLTTGLTLFEDDVEPRGGYVTQELAYQFLDDYDLVFQANYGFGSKIPQGRTDAGWSFGLAVRADLGLMSSR